MESIKKKTGLLAGFAAAFLLAAALLLAGCGGSGNSSSSTDSSSNSTAEDRTTLKVAAVPTPHAEVLKEVVQPILADEGIDLEVVEFTDYVQPNLVTEAGEVDANYFQHKPYLDSFNEENNTHLKEVVAVHFEPFALYSSSITSLDDLKDGDKVAVPNDTTNEARALLLLEQEGIIKLDPDAGVTATTNDIIENPKNLEFVEVEAANTPNVLPDVAIAAINGNYALEAELDPDTALAREADDSLAAQTYANYLVVEEGHENDEAIQKLADAITSEYVKNFFEEHFPGAVVAVF